MNFETGMENQTTPACCDADCDCSPDPALISDFKRAIHAIGGKWKLEILFALMNGAMRFGELRRAIAGITQHMLTTQLRELAQDGLVARTAFTEKPLRVEYELTDAGRDLEPAVRALSDWASKWWAPEAAPARAPAED